MNVMKLVVCILAILITIEAVYIAHQYAKCNELQKQIVAGQMPSLPSLPPKPKKPKTLKLEKELASENPTKISIQTKKDGSVITPEVKSYRFDNINTTQGQQRLEEILFNPEVDWHIKRMTLNVIERCGFSDYQPILEKFIQTTRHPGLLQQAKRVLKNLHSFGKDGRGREKFFAGERAFFYVKPGKQQGEQ